MKGSLRYIKNQKYSVVAASETVRSLGNVKQWKASGKEWRISGLNGWRVAVARLGLEAEANFPWGRDS